MSLLKTSAEVITLIMTCVLILAYLRWFLRERNLGPLLLDASQEPGRRDWGLAIWIALLAAGTVLDHRLGLAWWNTLLVLAYFYGLAWRHEFRKAGIVTGVHVFRWQKITSYAWSSGEGSGDSLLKLSIRKRLGIHSVNAFYLSKDKRPEADIILKTSTTAFDNR